MTARKLIKRFTVILVETANQSISKVKEEVKQNLFSGAQIDVK